MSFRTRPPSSGPRRRKASFSIAAAEPGASRPPADGTLLAHLLATGAHHEIKRRARRRAIGTRAPIVVEAKANARWSLDFVQDQLAWHFIAPGKPMQNGFCESFNGPHARTSLSTRASSLVSITPAPGSPPGSPTTICGVPHSALGLSHAGGIRRQSQRNRQSAAQPRPATPPACCSTRAARRKNPRSSIRRWMKLQRQVTKLRTRFERNATLQFGNEDGNF